MDADDDIVVVVRGDTELTRWPLCAPRPPDLAVVDALVRLQLAARRAGYTIRVENPSVELRELLDFAGLRVEALGEAEGSEQVGAEEVVMPDDPVA